MNILEMAIAAKMAGGNGTGGVSSWNDLTDKPFYETVKRAFEPIVWDGNTEGLESFQFESFGMMYTYHKVANYAKIEPSHIESIAVLMNGQEMVANEDMFQPDAGANEGHGWILVGNMVLISDGQFTMRGSAGVVIPEGIWFINSDFGEGAGTAICTTMTPKTETVVQTIDPKYIEIGYGLTVDENGAIAVSLPNAEGGSF